MNLTTLKQYRQLYKRTGRELAYLFGITREYYFELESGRKKPSPGLIIRIKKITGIESKYLLDQKKYLGG